MPSRDSSKFTPSGDKSSLHNIVGRGGNQENGKSHKLIGAPTPVARRPGPASNNGQDSFVVGFGTMPSRGPTNVGRGPVSSSNGAAGNGRRTSLMPQPQPGVPLVDFDSDDYSSDDEPQRGPPPPIGGFQGQKIPGVSPVSAAAGTAGARPLVGGFAAAAYEAARAHHYATKGRVKQTTPMPRRSAKRQIVY